MPSRFSKPFIILTSWSINSLSFVLNDDLNVYNWIKAVKSEKYILISSETCHIFSRRLALDAEIMWIFIYFWTNKMELTLMVIYKMRCDKEKPDACSINYFKLFVEHIFHTCKTITFSRIIGKIWNSLCLIDSQDIFIVFNCFWVIKFQSYQENWIGWDWLWCLLYNWNEIAAIKIYWKMNN